MQRRKLPFSSYCSTSFLFLPPSLSSFSSFFFSFLPHRHSVSRRCSALCISLSSISPVLRQKETHLHPHPLYDDDDADDYYDCARCNGSGRYRRGSGGGAAATRTSATTVNQYDATRTSRFPPRPSPHYADYYDPKGNISHQTSFLVVSRLPPSSSLWISQRSMGTSSSSSASQVVMGREGDVRGHTTVTETTTGAGVVVGREAEAELTDQALWGSQESEKEEESWLDEAGKRASTRMKEVFGPHANLVVQVVENKKKRRRNGRGGGSGGGEEEEEGEGRGIVHPRGPSSSSSSSSDGGGRNGAETRLMTGREARHRLRQYRASATFKLLGFMVELASVTGEDREEVAARCLELALESNIPFIDPRKKPPRQMGPYSGFSAHHQHEHQHDTSFASPSREARAGRGGEGKDFSTTIENGSLATGWEGSSWGDGGGGPTTLSQYGAERVGVGQRSSSSSSFLTPHEMELKAIIDELRELCKQFSRRLKFSIKSPLTPLQQDEYGNEEYAEQEGGAGDGSLSSSSSSSASARVLASKYVCRVYQKDEWFVVSRSLFVLETHGDNPRQALLRALVQLREQFQIELSSPEKWREYVKECEALLHPMGKRLRRVYVMREGSSKNGGTNEVIVDGKMEDEQEHDGRKGGEGCFRVGVKEEEEMGCVEGRDSLLSSSSLCSPVEEYLKKKEGNQEEEKEEEETGGVVESESLEGENTDHSDFSTPSFTSTSSATSSTTLSPVGLHTYTAGITIEDVFGNTHTSTVRRQRSPLVAYQQVCQQAMWMERSCFLPSAHLLEDFASSIAAPGGGSDGGGNHPSRSTSTCCLPSSPPPPPPLLTRLRWQVSFLSQCIAQALGMTEAESIVKVVIKGAKEDGGSGDEVEQKERMGMGEEEEGEEEGGEVALGKTRKKGSRKEKKKSAAAPGGGGGELFFTVTVTAMKDTSILSMNSGTGRYRLLLHAYVLALEYLFDAYPHACQAILLHSPSLQCRASLSLFPSPALLRDAVLQHDTYSVLSHHKGKWNCVAVLGTLTAALMGNYFQVKYIPPPMVGQGMMAGGGGGSHAGHGPATAPGAEWWAVLTVTTGTQSDELLVQKSAKTKGEALKRACLEALRENFPRQHAEVIRVHPDVDLSHDTLAKSSKYRSLPREKRVEHIQSLFAMVCAFAEEDLGWFQPRIRFRNTSMELGFPQWVAELEATVEEEQERRIVAVSMPHPQSRIAKRILIWQVAAQYFPKELGFYRALKRGDGLNPMGVEEDGFSAAGGGHNRRFQYYKPHAGISLVDQVFELMAPSHASLLPFSWTLKGVTVRSNKRKTNTGRRTAGDEDDGRGSEDSDDAAFALSDWVEEDDPSYWGDGETPDRLLEPLQIQYEASILGNHGDLIISDYRGKRLFSDAMAYLPTPSTATRNSHGEYEVEEGEDSLFPSGATNTGRQESPVEVLLTALKTASHHLCQAESETIWTEFETHEPPAMPSTRELCLYLFYTLWGGHTQPSSCPSSASAVSAPAPAATVSSSSSVPISGEEEKEEGGMGGNGGLAGGFPSSSSSSVVADLAYQPVVDVHAMKVGDQWVATLILPLLGALPVARAYGSTKKKSVKDALTLGARICFPQILSYWMRNTPSTSALAKEILTEPIMSVLPEAIKRDVRRQIHQEEKKKKKQTHPFPLLLKYLHDEYKGARNIRVDRSRASGNTWECRLYLQQRKLTVEKGLSQLVGYGAAESHPEKALHAAACMALENLYEVKYSDTTRM